MKPTSAGRHVGVGVDARAVRRFVGDRRELGPERSHVTRCRSASGQLRRAPTDRQLLREHGLPLAPLRVFGAGLRALIASALSAATSASRLCTRPLRLRRPFLCPHGVLAEQRKRDRRVDVGDHGVGQHARVHLAPADRLGRRRTRQAAPHHLVGRDLNEVVVAALRDAVDLPQRRLPLQVEVLRRAAAQDDAAVLVAGEDDGADLVDVLVRDRSSACRRSSARGRRRSSRSSCRPATRCRSARRTSRRWRRPSTPRSRAVRGADARRARSAAPRVDTGPAELGRRPGTRG